MTEDSMDLPSRGVAKLPTTSVEQLPAKQSRLSEKHIDTIISTGAKVLDSATTIAKDLMEIARIRTESQADVSAIDARTRALREAVRGEVDRLAAVRETIGKRGDVAVQLISVVLPFIPEAERHNSMEELRKIIAAVLADQGGQSVERL